MTRYSAIAFVPTAHASRYLQQLCKHWAHKLRVEFDALRGTVAFPSGDHPGEALAAFDAGEDHLKVRIEATSAEQLDSLKGVVARHLDRFAFREAPLVLDWSARSEAEPARALNRAD